MLIEFGAFALAAAFAAALIQALGLFPRLQLAHWARGAAMTQCIALSAAFMSLICAFTISDFSAKIIASNSHTLKPMIYKVAASWGNHEGSMLLWALILGIYGAVLARDTRLDNQVRSTAISIMGVLGAGVCLFLLSASNPFERLDPSPFEGRGLNPLLQDPALAIHPPILYAGYVGFAAPYALAISALWHRKTNRQLAAGLLRWSLAPVALLTLGVGLGSWWAYRELGWGGWWFWDPVENASLMPWLAGVAGLHMAMVWKRTGQFANTTLFAFLATFSLSVLGTFIVRSGALTSVHAFAVDPLRGTLILVFLGGVIGAGLIAFHRRTRTPRQPLQRTLSRELTLLAGAGLLAAATLTVVLGTLYPLLIEGLGGAPLTVGAPYFNQTAAPMMGLGVILLAIAPETRWGGAEGLTALKQPILIALGGGVIAAILSLAFAGLELGEAILIGVGMILPLLVIQYAIRQLGRQIGMIIAHAGMATATVGMVASASLSSETITNVSPGTIVEAPNARLVFGEVTRTSAKNYVREASEVQILAVNSERTIATLTPERRWYPAEEMVTTEAAIRSTLFNDLYITLGDLRVPGASDPDWALRVRYRPFISWIWFGLVLAFIGTLQSALKYTFVQAKRPKVQSNAEPVPAE